MIEIQTYSTELDHGGLQMPGRMTFLNTNDRVTKEMKKKLEPLIEEYNQKHK